MTRIKMHISKVKLPFYPPCEVKCGLQNGVLTTTRIGTTLSPEMGSILVQFLKENFDVFAWSHKDMPGISPKVIEYKLNVNPEKKPVQQKRRAFAPKWNQAITDEVNKLLIAGFI